MQLSFLPTDVHLTHIDPSVNMHRYYRLSLAPELFGGCALVREWGRIGRSCSRMVELHQTEGEAQDRLIQIAREKKGRGYTTAA